MGNSTVTIGVTDPIKKNAENHHGTLHLILAVLWAFSDRFDPLISNLTLKNALVPREEKGLLDCRKAVFQ